MNDWDKILDDFAHKCGDGGPDMTNPNHLALLRESLLKSNTDFNDYQFAVNEFVGELREAKSESGKYAKTWYNDKHDLTGKPYPTKKKKKKGKKKKKSEVELTDKQRAEEKRRNEEISKVLDLFTSKSSDEKGAGRFKLDKNDVKVYTAHLNLTPEERQAKQQKILDDQKEKIGEVTEADVDMALEDLQKKLRVDTGKKYKKDRYKKNKKTGEKELVHKAGDTVYDNTAYNAVIASIKKKGDPPGEFTADEAGNQRVRNVIKHYLQTGGVSAITGEVVPFSDSQLDHMVSLDNWEGDGPADGPHNWEWMEARFNQFKGARTEPEVKAKLIERGMKTESEWLLELNEDELKQYQKVEFVAYWETKFEKGDVANISSVAIENMTNDEVNYLTKAWNNYVGDENDSRFIPRYGDRQTTQKGADGKPKKMSYSRGGVVKPKKNDSDTWGWEQNKKTGKWEQDKTADYNSSKAKFDTSRASGGQTISRDELQMKLIGGTDEVTGQKYKGVLKTDPKFPKIPDEDEEQDMDIAMRDILEYKLNKKEIIDKYKENRKNNPKSSAESGKRVKKALENEPWFRKWSKKEKKKNPEEYKKWETKRNKFVLAAWEKELKVDK